MSRLSKTLLTILAILVALCLVAEVGARWYAGKEVADDFQAQAAADGVPTDAKPSVSFGLNPVILAAVTNNIGHVDLDVPSTLKIDGDSVAGQPAAHIVIDDLDVSNRDQPIAGKLTASSTLSNEFLLATLRQATAPEAAAQSGAGIGTQILRSLVQVTGLSSNGADGTMNIEIGGGAASATVAPAPSGDVVTFAVTDTKVLGMDLPPEFTRQITQALQEAISQQLARFGGLSITEAKVTDDGLEATVRGSNVDISKLDVGAQE